MRRPSGRVSERTRHPVAARLRNGIALVLLALIPLAGVPAAVAAPLAPAKDYPSWSDVQQAKKNEAKAKEAVQRIRSLIAQLADEVEAAQKVAKEKGEVYAAAQTAYDEQAYIADQLQTQADAAEAEADEAQRSAAQLIAGLARGSGADVTIQLFAQGGGDADALLYNLAASQKFSDTNQLLYERAIQLQNAAQALTDQAEVATDLLDELREVAEAAYQEALEAQEAAQAVYDEQLSHQAELEEQLAYLTGVRRETVEDYDEGIREQYGNNAGGYISSSGWANPTAGYISSPFGQRYHPIYEVWKLHTGTDIAGGGLGAPIYAASGGTVIYAGWFSDLGNFIKIQHPNGIVTGYGHIISGGILVRAGQHVDVGQQIAKVGSTGGSTGPHLHFMVYRNGVLTDPVPFMRDRGIRLGG